MKMCLKYDIGFKLKLLNVASNKTLQQALSGTKLSSPPLFSGFKILSTWSHKTQNMAVTYGSKSTALLRAVALALGVYVSLC